ncbi:hypothetical protein C7M84_011135 [Penaeus vannamei]|uniref:Uncharacterized protein n=1 Tax=Penaeus vannamei TaxID=6689 RepID=A0A3R7MV65_PENVA|nr:hypothetical protein C7M84_011135 [Penaeus vannamei]
MEYPTSQRDSSGRPRAQKDSSGNSPCKDALGNLRARDLVLVRSPCKGNYVLKTHRCKIGLVVEDFSGKKDSSWKPFRAKATASWKDLPCRDSSGSTLACKGTRLGGGIALSFPPRGAKKKKRLVWKTPSCKGRRLEDSPARDRLGKTPVQGTRLGRPSVKGPPLETSVHGTRLETSVQGTPTFGILSGTCSLGYPRARDLLNTLRVKGPLLETVRTRLGRSPARDSSFEDSRARTRLKTSVQGTRLLEDLLQGLVLQLSGKGLDSSWKILRARTPWKPPQGTRLEDSPCKDRLDLRQRDRHSRARTRWKLSARELVLESLRARTPLRLSGDSSGKTLRARTRLGRLPASPETQSRGRLPRARTRLEDSPCKDPLGPPCKDVSGRLSVQGLVLWKTLRARDSSWKTSVKRRRLGRLSAREKLFRARTRLGRLSVQGTRLESATRLGRLSVQGLVLEELSRARDSSWKALRAKRLSGRLSVQGRRLEDSPCKGGRLRARTRLEDSPWQGLSWKTCARTRLGRLSCKDSSWKTLRVDSSWNDFRARDSSTLGRLCKDSS